MILDSKIREVLLSNCREDLLRPEDRTYLTQVAEEYRKHKDKTFISSYFPDRFCFVIHNPSTRVKQMSTPPMEVRYIKDTHELHDVVIVVDDFGTKVSKSVTKELIELLYLLIGNAIRELESEK